MIRLRTFGSTDLRGPDGSEVSAVLAQPKRFALLAYLAAAQPHGVHRRDRLLALFWPERNEERARDALNQALHFLRRALGSEVLLRRSAEDVGVDPDLLWCDVPAFRAAADEERWGEALALYRGDFLEGFFVEGSEGFERWLEEERSALRDLAARGARELARRHEDAESLTLAIDWGRRALDIVPDDERALRRLLALHIRADDHAGALSLYEGFARRMEEEWDLAPSPETRRIVDDLRNRHVADPPTVESPGRSDPPPAADELDWTDGDGFLTDRYRIERELGTGGSATVYLARDLKHDRFVAVKVLASAVTEGLARDRFLREIRIASQLQHPGIVPLFDSGEANGRLYYVMPVVQGETLRYRLRQGPMEPDVVVGVLREVAESLRHAHDQGIVHRDIKPENILLVGRRALVTDFGIARAAEAARPPGGPESVLLTQIGTSLGTPTYSSPEQAAGDPRVNHLTDLYSLGVLGYEMVAGRPPFTGDTPQQILARKLTRAPPDLLELRPEAPAWLAELIMRCLEREPRQRPQTAKAVVAQLRARRVTPVPAPTAVAGRVRRLRGVGARVSRRSWVALAVVAVALLSAALRGMAGADAGDGDPSLVLVLPFRVAGGGDAMHELREGVVDLTSIYLTGDEGGLRAVEPTTFFRAWQARPDDGSDREVDDEEALGLARDLGAGWVLRGSIVGTGNDVLLRASLEPVGEGDALHASVTGAADSLLAHVPRLLGRFLAQVDGIPPDQTGSLTTASLDAVRAYLVGQRHYRRGEYAVAVDRFTEALGIDPDFGLAGLGLLMAHEWSGSAPEDVVDAATETAWRNRDRLRAKDRALIAAVLGPAGTGRSPLADVQAAREHATLVAADRFEAWYLLADHLFHVGALLGIDGSLPRAEEAFQRSLELDPGQAGVLQHLIQIAAWRRDTADVREHWVEYSTLVPDPAVRFKDEWLVGRMLGDTVLTQRALEHFDGGEAAYLGLQSLAFSVSLFPDLIEPLRELLARTAPAMARREHREYLTLVHRWLTLDAGRLGEAGHTPAELEIPTEHQALHERVFWGAERREESRTIATTTEGLAVCALGLWHADEGRWDEVGEAVARLPELGGSLDTWIERRQAEVCRRILEAAHAQGTGSPEAQRLVLAVDSLMLTVPYLQIYWENLVVARLLEREGEYARAAAAASRYRVGLGYPHYMAAYLREGGRMAERAGDREGAIDRFTRYLSLRSDPGPAAMVEVAAVRAALDSLVSGRE